MNREIKFRAWGKKTMLYRGLFDRNWYSHPTECKTVCGINPRDINTMYVMQFTGLQDKNGKDIYEFDIISFGKDFEYKYIVEFIDGCFMLVHSELKNDYDKKPIVWGNLIKAIDDIIFKSEIIGNIYQNPELL